MGKRIHQNPNHWSDIVGMPDEWDLKNLTNLINNFKKQKFTIQDKTFTGQQWIDSEVADAKKQHQSDDPFNEYGVKVKDSEVRIGTAMPNVLWEQISESYPSMFRDKKHFTWFVSKFPEFKVAKRF